LAHAGRIQGRAGRNRAGWGGANQVGRRKEDLAHEDRAQGKAEQG